MDTATHIRPRDGILRLFDGLSLLARERASVMAVTVVLGLLAYIPLWTEVLFTNHTLPNVWVYGFPSFKTSYEGRWAADMFIQLTGGAGAQSLQFVLAMAIKAINVQLFCMLFGLRRGWPMVLVAAVLVLHPTFLDYYAYTVDAVTFEGGDTLALLGALALARMPGRWAGPVLAAGLFVLATASYQPKLALCITLVLLWLASLGGDDRDRGFSTIEAALRAAGAIILAVILYFISLKLLVHASGGERQHINTFAQIAYELLVSWPETFQDFTWRVDYLPKPLRLVPLLVILGGLAIAMRHAGRRGLLLLALVCLAVLALPPALRLTYLINDQAWANVGRILSPHAYLLAYGLIMLLRTPIARWAAGVAAFTMAWSFFALASQEMTAASMKTIFDEAKVNRIVARIESVVPYINARQRPLVVVGELGWNEAQPLKRFANKLYGSQFQTEMFIDYRQVHIVNFYLGRDATRRPTPDERAMALVAAKGRPAWPAVESVSLAGDAVLVVLKPYGPNVPVTWTTQQ